MCQSPIVFPTVTAAMKKTSLRLVRDIPKPVEKTHFSFTKILRALLEFKHWKLVGFCLVPFLIVAAGLVASSHFRQQDSSAPAATASVAAPPSGVEDMAQADQQVRASVKAVQQANAVLQTAIKNKAPDAECKNAQMNLAAARTAFETAFANYQSLGGPTDYRRQLP